MLGRDALRVELHRMDRQAFMAEAHDARVIFARCLGMGIGDEAIGHIDHFEAVIARGGERRGYAFKKAAPVMGHRRRLAVHKPAARDRSAKMLSDALMSKTYAHQGFASICTGGNQIEANARFIWSAGPGRNEKTARIGRKRLGRTQRIIALNPYIRAQLHQVMDQIEGEAVVIVDDEDLAHLVTCKLVSRPD